MQAWNAGHEDRIDWDDVQPDAPMQTFTMTIWGVFSSAEAHLRNIDIARFKHTYKQINKQTSMGERDTTFALMGIAILLISDLKRLCQLVGWLPVAARHCLSLWPCERILCVVKCIHITACAASAPVTTEQEEGRRSRNGHVVHTQACGSGMKWP
jgi:hypothetical protein